MATKALLDTYKLAVQALAEKHEVPVSEVRGILEEVPNQVLANLDWKDLDSIVQEVLIAKASGVKGEFNWKEFVSDEEADMRELPGFPEEFPE